MSAGRRRRKVGARAHGATRRRAPCAAPRNPTSVGSWPAAFAARVTFAKSASLLRDVRAADKDADCERRARARDWRATMRARDKDPTDLRAHTHTHTRTAAIARTVVVDVRQTVIPP